ncbi:putative leucine-rich repeat receptor-like serine/threonine-protein kinase At2g24130 [Elaeis guineensis]|uniref:putative leucine-rich repeat receptor-like serine/threonine-protein kinase At2g24130 n=1 Tax=Elaeis guineensis var. tenera TaxID=51953 RepID=UPI003C6CD33E
MRIITACSLYSGSSELSLIQRAKFCSNIAEGITCLHQHSPVKVIHCDLKPSNVLLNDHMTALISDFGIARLVIMLEWGIQLGLTTKGAIGYIASEFVHGLK